jgi:hypothetical protein
MTFLGDDVFDAALDFVAACTEANVKDGSTILVDAITINAGNFGSPGDWSSGSDNGRAIECLQSSASDMLSIAVTGSGSADTVALLDASAAIQVVASISGSDVALSSGDKVNLGTFSVIIKDPT